MRFLLLLVAASTMACAGAPTPRPLPRNPPVAHPDLDEQALFVTVCGECHPPKNPADYRRAAWGRILQRYVERSSLHPADEPRLLEYLQAHAKDAAPADYAAPPR